MILTPALAAQLRSDQFRRTIADAPNVEVRASQYVPPDNIYALDVTPGWSMPDWAPDYLRAPDDMRKIMVICAPQHREFCENLVAQIRAKVDLETLMALFLRRTQ